MTKLIVVSDYGNVNGGAAQVAIAGLNGLVDSGFDVTFVSSVGPVDSHIDQSRVRIVNFGFADLLSNPSRVAAAYHGIWDRRCAIKLGDVLDDCDPRDTVVHLHTWVKSLSASVVHEILRRGYKLVVTLHDYFSICPNGGLYNYTKQQHCEITPMSVACLLTNCDAKSYAQKLWRYGRHVVQQQMAGMPNRVEHFISISDYSEALLRPFLPSKAKIYRVRNPIDISKITPTNVENNDAFTFIGRLSPEKGGTLFSTAACLAGVRSVFIGCGDEEKKIREANQSAELSGWQSREGVVRAIQSSRAIVFPSLLHETQGLAVMEAAALGVSAVVSDGCAARETIIDGVTGLLFRAGDVSDLSAKLAILRNNPELAQTLGENAYERYWRSPCTIGNHVNDLISCYGELLNNKITQ